MERLFIVLLTMTTASLVAMPAGAGNPALFSRVSNTESFHHQLSEPNIRISLADVPRIEMKQHPLHPDMPQMRALGSNGTIEITIITPTADPGMTATECASISASTILARNGLKPEQALSSQLNDDTYLLLYGLSHPDFVQLNAHILSASSENYCVEVHVTKRSTSQSDFRPWFGGWGESKIEEY